MWGRVSSYIHTPSPNKPATALHCTAFIFHLEHRRHGVPPCRVDQHEGVAPPQLLDVGRQRLVPIICWALLDGRPASMCCCAVFVLIRWRCAVCPLSTRGAIHPSTAKTTSPESHQAETTDYTESGSRRAHLNHSSNRFHSTWTYQPKHLDLRSAKQYPNRTISTYI